VKQGAGTPRGGRGSEDTGKEAKHCKHRETQKKKNNGGRHAKETPKPGPKSVWGKRGGGGGKRVCSLPEELERQKQCGGKTFRGGRKHRERGKHLSDFPKAMPRTSKWHLVLRAG